MGKDIETPPPAGALTKMGKGDVARPEPPPPTFDIEGMFRFALEKGAGPEAMTTLMNVRRELNAEAAKKAFDTSMAAFQKDCPIITKDKPGGKTKGGIVAYKYAAIEMIEVQIRECRHRHGFSHTFDTDTASQEGWVIAKCIVKHEGGHSEVSSAKFPLGSRTEIMSDTQVYAAALTFATRRALCNAYGLVIAGEDLDGATGRYKPQQGPSTMQPTDSGLKKYAKELWDLLVSVRGDKHNWDTANQWLWKQEILDGAVPEVAPNLTEDKFKTVIAKVKEKLK